MSQYSPVFLNGKYLRTSPSQIKLAEQCFRKWYNNYVLKIKEPEKPYQKFGKDVHAANELYLNTGNFPTEDTDENKRLALFVKAAVPFLPEPKIAEVEIEINIPTYENGPIMNGYIDCGLPKFGPPKVLDHKTTSDLEYAKTEEGLANDIQMITYAKYYLDLLNVNEIEIAHLYLQTRNKKPKVKYVHTIVDKNQIYKVWNAKLDIVREIQRIVEKLSLSEKDESEQVTPNVDSCGLYGGCFYRNKCGIKDKTTIIFENFIDKREKEASKMGQSLSEKLKAAQENKELTKSSEIYGSGGIVNLKSTGELLKSEYSLAPPDAPPNLEIKPLSETVEARPKRGRPKQEVKEIKAEETVIPVQSSFKLEDYKPVNELSTLSLNRKRCSIYIDSIALKGPDKGKAVMAEDFLVPIMQKVAEDNGVADYRLIQYTAKAALAIELRRRLNEIPEVLLVSSYAAGSDVLLEVLTPIATEITKKLG